MNTTQPEKPPQRTACGSQQAPKVRDLYWCDFPKDAHLPEFWKRRPVIVLAGDRTLGGVVSVDAVLLAAAAGEPLGPPARDHDRRRGAELGDLRQGHGRRGHAPVDRHRGQPAAAPVAGGVHGRAAAWCSPGSRSCRRPCRPQPSLDT